MASKENGEGKGNISILSTPSAIDECQSNQDQQCDANHDMKQQEIDCWCLQFAAMVFTVAMDPMDQVNATLETKFVVIVVTIAIKPNVERNFCGGPSAAR